MADGEFAYTTYIKTTPERLWEALTNPAFTRRYWGVIFESDWAEGSSMSWELNGVKVSDPDQVVLESEPYRRLAYTWHSFTPEFAKVIDLNDEDRARVTSEQRSKVTFDIEPLEHLVKLTVIHEGGSAVVGMVSQGWPHLLSSLKTFLETGEPLPEATAAARAESAH